MTDQASGNSHSSLPATSVYSIAGVKLMLLHLDPEGKIVYANSPLLRFFGIRREDIIGRDRSLLAKAGHPAIVRTLLKLEQGKNTSEHVEDAAGKHFEINASWKDGSAFVVIEETSEQHILKSYVSRYVSRDLDKLTEEDLRTFRFPERRRMTVSFTDLRGFTAMSEKMSPDQVHTILNAFLECAIRAVHDNDATVDKIVGDQIMALYGAPRRNSLHALQAVKTALDQIYNLNLLREEMAKSEIAMPACGVGINTGDMIVGNVGSEIRQDYTVIGSNVNLAARLCSAAEVGQVLISQATLDEILDHLPEDWEKQVQEDGKICEIGPRGRPVFRFARLGEIEMKGIATPLPAIQATRLFENGADPGAVLKPSHHLDTAKSDEKIFGKYRLLELAGKGGMAEVWKAKDVFGNPVAIKMLLAEESPGILRRFEREGEILRNLDHPNICRITEIGIYERRHYIAMEMLPGVTLDALLMGAQNSESTSLADLVSQTAPTIIEETGLPFAASDTLSDSSAPPKTRTGQTEKMSPLRQQHALHLMQGVLSAVQHAHDHGVVHRDLKPGNVMVKPNGEPVVMDFGLGRFDSAEHSMTMSMQIVGTLDFMAPEQSQSAVNADERSDVFSAGAILYYLLTGRKWVQLTGNILQDTALIAEHEVVPPRRWNRKIQKDLETIVLKAMEKDPSRRYSSAQAFLDDLERFKKDEAILARPASTIYKLGKFVRKNRIPLAATATVVVAIATVGAFISAEKAKERAYWGEPVFVEKFVTPEWEDNWKPIKNRFQLQDGRLTPEPSEAVRGFAICYVRKLKIPVAIEYDAMIHEGAPAGDISTIWRADTSGRENQGSRYYFQVAADRGSEVRILKLAPPGYETQRIAADSFSAVAGKPYHIRAEIDEMSLSLYVNGQLVCAYQDPFPISTGYFGLYAFGPGRSFDNIRVYSKGVAEKISALSVGNAFYHRGMDTAAVEEYRRVAESHSQSPIARKAQEKIAICYQRMGRYQEAMQIWSGLRQGERQAAATLMLSQLHVAQSQFDSAIQTLETINENMRFQNRKLLKAHIANVVETKNNLEFVSAFQRLFPDDKSYGYQMADALIRHGKLDEVIRKYPDQRNICAWALHKQAKYERVLEKYPDQREACAQSLVRMGRPEEVLTHYPDQRGICALALIELGRYEDVISDYNDQPGMRARALYDLRRYRQVLEEHPNARAICARSLVAMGQQQRVLEEYDDIRRVCAEIHFRRGDYGKVLSEYSDVRNTCAWSLIKLGKLEKVADEYIDTPRPHSRALIMLGRYGEILERYRGRRGILSRLPSHVRDSLGVNVEDD